ncbi:hypothetical protein T4B_4406 [Trichinella pseudospiralis]|uniref:Uncharacterized protein n=1 Tax=Trichinella pseudospiralis TaxID=6337 RepID=A0A0V1EGT0_TRIPS|nr:hypothetical protein T4A_7021 [Trichinella pseudospiralis]KRZ35037.1 hypothetical protein T4B_4406 [Trichinella pseudospiralis]
MNELSSGRVSEPPPATGQNTLDGIKCSAGEKSLQISQFCRIPNSGFEMHTRFKLILELLEPRHVEFTQLVLWQPNRHLWLTRDTLNSPYHGASLTHAEFRIIQLNSAQLLTKFHHLL